MKKLFAFILPLTVALFAFAANEAIKPEGEGTKEAPYLLTSVENLVWMGENIAECQSNVFRLENDIDLGQYREWKKRRSLVSHVEMAWGFLPIGSYMFSKDQKAYSFCGVFDGQNYTIKNLYSTGDECNTQGSLFYVLLGAEVKNLKLTNINVGSLSTGGGQFAQGGLAASIDNSTITNVHVSGVVRGNEIGGLAARIDNSSIVNSSFSGKLDCFVSVSKGCGGLAAYCYDSNISCCRTSGVVSSIGRKQEADERFCLGGLFGYIGCETKIVNCYSDMQLISKGVVGGLVGKNYVVNCEEVFREVITNDFGLKGCFANCTIEKTPEATIGGLCGFVTTNSVCFECYYNSDLVSGTDYGTGVSSSKIKQKSTFKNWDFSTVWSIDEGAGTPYFRFEEGKYLKVALVDDFFGTVTVEPEKDGYTRGEIITISAKAGEGSLFLGYTGALEGQEPQQTLQISDNLVVIAAFAKNIDSKEELGKIGNAYPVNEYFIQTADIDLSDTVFTNVANYFWGIYDGQNHSISNWKVPDGVEISGLFNQTYEAAICNLQLLDLDFNYTLNASGCLVGTAYNSFFSNCFVLATLRGAASGLGGICAVATRSEFVRCIFHGNIRMLMPLGGLVYWASYSTIRQSAIEISSGGACGLADIARESQFIDCYAKVNDFRNFLKSDKVLVSNCYFYISAKTTIPGTGTFVNCYFNSNFVAKTEGVTGFVSDEDMKKQATYAGWDFENIWGIEEGVGTPYFQYALPEPIGFLALLGLALLGMKRRLG